MPPPADLERRLVNANLAAFFDDPEAPVPFLHQKLYSLESYQQLGFEPEIAAQLWETFRSDPVHTPEDFMDIVREHIVFSGEQIPQDEDDEAWTVYMSELGITADRQIKIYRLATSRRRDVTYNAEWWVWMAMKVKWTALRGVNIRLRRLRTRILRVQEAERLLDHMRTVREREDRRGNAWPTDREGMERRRRREMARETFGNAGLWSF